MNVEYGEIIDAAERNGTEQNTSSTSNSTLNIEL